MHIPKKRESSIKGISWTLVDIIIQCRHKVNHISEFSIESLIGWKIVNGVCDGVFKNGYGLRSRYSNTDDEKCVNYHPSVRGSNGDCKEKQILISIIIRSNKIEGSFENFSAKNYYYDYSNTLLTPAYATQLLMLHLKQKQGFLNKMYYESPITVRQTDKRGIRIFKQSDSYKRRKLLKFKSYMFIWWWKQRDFSIENKYVSKYSKCKLRITFQFPDDYSAINQSRISIYINRILFSEHIKISNSIFEYIHNSESRLDIEVESKKKQ